MGSCGPQLWVMLIMLALSLGQMLMFIAGMGFWYRSTRNPIAENAKLQQNVAILSGCAYGLLMVAETFIEHYFKYGSFWFD